MAGNTSGLVSAAKPQKGGAIFTAPAGTAIPTDAPPAAAPRSGRNATRPTKAAKPFSP